MSDVILIIDTGTTNTRVTAWRDGKPIAYASESIGVRDTAVTGNKQALYAGIRRAIEHTLQHADVGVSKVTLALASGMITSDLGLHEVPHCLAPASIDDLAIHMRQALIPEVFDLPIWFIPGVRNAVNNVGLHNCEAIDMLRGEEAEAMGLIARLDLTEPAVVIFPGSHSKFVMLDADQRISACLTTLSGELLDVITHHTILADSLGHSFGESLDAEMVLAGAHLAQQVGLGRACFSVRNLARFTTYDRNALANFLLGAILDADLLALKKTSAFSFKPDTNLVITGKYLLREAISLLIKQDDYFSGSVKVITDEQQQNLSCVGALSVAARRGLIPTDSLNRRRNSAVKEATS